MYTRNLNTYVLSDISREGRYTIPITNPDPGPDGRLGTGDDTGRSLTYYEYPSSLAGASFASTMFINSSAADSNFKTFEIALTKRPAQGWQVGLSVLEHLAGQPDRVQRHRRRARQHEFQRVVSGSVRHESQPGPQHGQ